MRSCLLTVTLFLSVASAQIDTLQEKLKFFPLRTGDYREYKVIGVYSLVFSDSSLYSIETLGDTVLSNGVSYKILRHRDLYPHKSSYPFYQRLDTSDGCIYEYYGGDTSLKNQEYIIDSLFASPGDTIQSAWEHRVYGTERPVCDSIVYDSILGTPTRTRYAHNIKSLEYVSYTLCEGFGLKEWFSGFDYGWAAHQLVYARIDGVEYGTEIIVNVRRQDERRPSFHLFQNYPNPFNPSTAINYELAFSTQVELTIFDAAGRVLRTLVNTRQNAGTHSVIFDASDLPSGVYFCRLEAGPYHDTKKFLFLK